jgi:acetyl-CoA C-acetyltransferase
MSRSENSSVIVSVARTPFARLNGALSSLSAVELGAHAIREALIRACVDPSSVDHLTMGMVLQAGAGQIPSRQAGLLAGLPVEVPSVTVNKVCASGLVAIAMADQQIRLGDGEIHVAGGMESMTGAPYLLPKGRSGLRLGHGQALDAMMHDGLTCAIHHVAMGVHGDTTAAEFGQAREALDAWAARSHQRAHAAMQSGVMACEIAALTIPGKKGASTEVRDDESVRADSTSETLARLRPAFTPDGLITAGNAPGISDGACALVIMSESRAHALGHRPIARIVGHARVAQEARYLSTVPGLAARRLLERHGLRAEAIDRFEINEAFAAVTLKSTEILADGDPGLLEAVRARTNVHGGAIALGHPIGASGARIVASLALEMQREGLRYGIAAICSGAAQGDAVLLERLS